MSSFLHEIAEINEFVHCISICSLFFFKKIVKSKMADQMKKSYNLVEQATGYIVNIYLCHSALTEQKPKEGGFA